MTTHAGTLQPTILPPGLADRLPPFSAANLRTTQALMECFMGFGYEPVTPAIIEYAETITQNNTDGAHQNYFQFLDPLSNQLLALRSDMTGQISRIARTSMGSAPRPLRLCYAGQRVLALPETLHTRREHRQIGIEYIGATGIQADAEVIVIAEQALSRIGLGQLILDIHMPVLLHSVLNQLSRQVRVIAYQAVARKDKEALRACGADFLADLLDVSGTPEEVSRFLKGHKQAVIYASTELDDLTSWLDKKGCSMKLQVDALDGVNHDNYQGISFSIFSSNPEMEVARGGRYALTDTEQAVGFTLYLDDVLGHLPSQNSVNRLAIPEETNAAYACDLQSQGYQTRYSKEIDSGTLKALGFTHQLIDNTIISI